MPRMSLRQQRAHVNHLHCNPLSFWTKLKAWVMWMERGLWILGLCKEPERHLWKQTKDDHVFWFQLPFKSTYFSSEWSPLFTRSQPKPKGWEAIWTLFSSLVSNSVNRTTSPFWAPGLTRCSLFPHKTHGVAEFWGTGRPDGSAACRTVSSHLAPHGQLGEYQLVCGSWFWRGLSPLGSSEIPRKRYINSYVPSGFQGVCALQAKNLQMAAFKTFSLWGLDPNLQPSKKVFKRIPL